MSFLENVAEKAKQYANIAADKAKDVASAAADKARDMKETAQLTMAIKSEQREMDKNYRAIGQWFVSEYEGETPDAVKDVVAAIEASKAKVEEMEAILAEKPRTEIEITIEKGSELKTCPVCGTAASSPFCPECGAEMSPKAEEAAEAPAAETEAPAEPEAPAAPETPSEPEE